MCNTMKRRFAASDDVAEPARVAFTDASRVAALTAMTPVGCRRSRAPRQAANQMAACTGSR
jgi:hypothetical protein